MRSPFIINACNRGDRGVFNDTGAADVSTTQIRLCMYYIVCVSEVGTVALLLVIADDDDDDDDGGDGDGDGDDDGDDDDVSWCFTPSDDDDDDDDGGGGSDVDRKFVLACI